MKLWTLLVLFACAAALRAQPLIDAFPYTHSPLDTMSSASLLLPVATPAGQQGRIGMANGRFVYPDGSPARFLGTVLYNTACFPDSTAATALAQRLRALGFNAVRFMNYDYSYWNESSLLQSFSTGSSNGFDPEQLQRFDWLVYQLKKNGLYIHLPLLAARTARQNDGITAWDSIPYGGRAVTFFDSALQHQHRLFIRRLMEHTNPYTGTAYKDEAALAWVDITDNNSLFLGWLAGWLSHEGEGALLSVYHSRMLDTLFATYLHGKYSSDMNLDHTWNSKASTTANLLANPGYEDPFSSVWALDLADNVQALIEPSETDKKEGSRSLRLRINKANGTPVSIMLSNVSAKIEKQRLYQLRFWAKTSLPSRGVRLHLQMSYAPFANLGINYQAATFTDQWQEYTIPFRATETDNNGARLSFFCGETTGDIFLDDVHITMIDEPGLLPGEHLTTATIHRPTFAEGPAFSPQRTRDLMEFYTNLASGYNTDMRSFIRDTLGCQALVGGGTSGIMLNDLYSIRNMDFTAASESWDYVRNQQDNWYIGNDGMVGNIYAGRIPFIARQAIDGKPTVVTQFVMPYPSAYANEMLTLLPAYAAYQGWDAVYIGAYSTDRMQFAADSIAPGNFYNDGNNPALMSLVPSAAGAFRRELISLAQKRILLDQTQEALLYPYALWYDAFWLESRTDNRLPLFRRVSVARFNAAAQSIAPHTDVFQLSGDEVNTSELLSDSGELLWNADDTLFTINTPCYVAATGNIGGPVFRFGSILAERISGGRTGTFTWISADTTPVASAQYSLLTLSSRALNSGAVWQGDSTVRSNPGTAPTVVEPMSIALTLPGNADSLLAYPLDATGMPTGEVIAAVKNQGKFRLIIDQKQHPSLWFRIEQKKSTTDIPVHQFAEEQILAVHPQPIREEACIDLRLPAGTAVRLSIIDITGIETEVWTGTMPDSRYTLPISRRLASGIYIMRASTTSGIYSTPFTILR